MKGIVVFKEANKNSKSEGLFPFLYVGEGKFVKIYLASDNPFENNALKKYDAKEVVIEGEFNDNNLFLIDTIDVVKEEGANEVISSQEEIVSEENN